MGKTISAIRKYFNRPLVKQALELAHEYFCLLVACCFLVCSIYAYNNYKVWTKRVDYDIPKIVIQICSPVMVLISAYAVLSFGTHCFKDTKRFVLACRIPEAKRQYQLDLAGDSIKSKGIIKGSGKGYIKLEVDSHNADPYAEIIIDVLFKQKSPRRKQNKQLVISPGLLETECEFSIDSNNKWQVEILLCVNSDQDIQGGLDVTLKSMATQQASTLPEKLVQI